MTGASIEIVEFSKQYQPWVTARTEELFGGDTVVTGGKVFKPAELNGFIALAQGEQTPVGLATYQIEDGVCELVTIDAFRQWQGIGSALLLNVENLAREKNCQSVFLTTTNDNVDALRFYQKRDYCLRNLAAGAVSDSRRIKPEIPEKGNYGIPIRDELSLVKYL